jgi:hypothetical protein
MIHSIDVRHSHHQLAFPETQIRNADYRLFFNEKAESQYAEFEICRNFNIESSGIVHRVGRVLLRGIS